MTEQNQTGKKTFEEAFLWGVNMMMKAGEDGDEKLALAIHQTLNRALGCYKEVYNSGRADKGGEDDWGTVVIRLGTR